jgi:hypothetical protein
VKNQERPNADELPEGFAPPKLNENGREALFAWAAKGTALIPIVMSIPVRTVNQRFPFMNRSPFPMIMAISAPLSIPSRTKSSLELKAGFLP